MRLAKLTRVTMAALLAAGTAVYLPAIADAQQTDAGPGLSLDAIREQEALSIAKDAYIYAYPLVTMELTRRVMTNAAEPTAMHAPMGQLANAREYPNASFKDVTAPNADTLYSAGWVDVGKEPWILSLPEENGRYYLFPLLSAWTNVIADPGKRTTGTGPQTYAITGPNWKGTLPEGVRQISSPTNLVWLLGRTYCTGSPEDYKAAWAIQDGYKLAPLSSYSQTYTPPLGTVDPAIHTKTPVREQVEHMDAASFFQLAAALMKDNPPAPEDAAILSRIAKIGIAPGHEFDINRFGPAAAKGIARAPSTGVQEISAHAKDVGTIENGWILAAKKMGRYGTDYLQRAIVTMVGLGANLPQDAVYPMTNIDSRGSKLNGANKYAIHFEKGQLPPVDGFWSLTMYNDKYFFVDNPLNRYTLSQRNKLATNEDGSIDLYIQADSPGKEKEPNWLPAPRGDMNLMLRLYWPKETPPSILDGSWQPPKVQLVAPRQARAATGTDGATPARGAATSRAPVGTNPSPVAGVSRLGIVTGEIEVAYKGWSVQRFLNQNVHNDRGEQIGFVNDIIVSPDKVVTYAIIGTGGFLGYDEHNVAFPIAQFKLVDGEIVLPNVTAASVASMPAFRYVDSDFQSASTE
jgi:hypothetical protein